MSCDNTLLIWLWLSTRHTKILNEFVACCICHLVRKRQPLKDFKFLKCSKIRIQKLFYPHMFNLITRIPEHFCFASILKIHWHITVWNSALADFFMIRFHLWALENIDFYKFTLNVVTIISILIHSKSLSHIHQHQILAKFIDLCWQK